MSLFETLKKASSEEDVKDAYIKALGLKNVQKNLIDIQTKEIWFEAKDKPTSTYSMFTQLLHYVDDAFKKGEYVPPFLCVIDTSKAAIMRTADVLPLLKSKNIKWGKSASKFTPEALEEVSNFIGTYFVSFKIETHEREFIDTVKLAIQTGEIIRTQITPDNLKQVFDKWVAMVGRELSGVSESDYALLFYADIMHDGKNATHEHLTARLLHDGEKPVFLLHGVAYNLGNYEGYRQFWAIYHKPPKAEHRNYLLERRDSLIPLDERSFKGAFYTPLHVVDKAYDLLSETLGNSWQKNYIVWDMCCGVGNLEVKHSNHRNVFMSTLDQADVDVMKASKTCVAATRFQYDYLNDDINDFGQIDYSLTNKVPAELQQAIKDGKKILVLINPPYAEATNHEKGKSGVARTKFSSSGMNKFGKASNELYTQFIARIATEIPTATVAIFSTLKYFSAPTLDKFRDEWQANYLDGFVVHSRAFDGLDGDFPIGFLIWNTNQNIKINLPSEISLEVLNKNADPIGEKIFLNTNSLALLTDWIERPSVNKRETVPLKNAITPATASKDLRGTKWSDGAIAWLNCAGNDLQNAANKTMLFSSGYGSGRGFFVNVENLEKSAIVFSIRRLIKPTWINDRDQFLQPTKPLTDEFKNDCLIWMLFNGSNLSASANDLEWNDKKWSIVNHFIPYTEAEVNAPDRFESDFMVQYLSDKTLSPEAQAVMNEGRKLWQAYFSRTDTHNVRELLKLNRADVGWYQVRKALEERNKEGSNATVDFSIFKAAYDALGDKLRPMVFELGFMR